MSVYEHEETGKLVKSGGWISNREQFLARMGKRARAWEAALEDLDWSKASAWMVTLTYRPGEEWERGQITNYRMALQKELGSALIAYFWWAQLQPERGVIHYHFVLVKRVGSYFSKPDESGMWPCGMSNVKHLKRAGLGVGYAIGGYAGSKNEQYEGEFPKGMHKFEVWIRDDVIGKAAYWFFRLSAAPEWVADRALKLVAIGEEVGFPKLIREDFGWGSVGVWTIGRVRLRSPWQWVSGFDWLYADAKLL